MEYDKTVPVRVSEETRNKLDAEAHTMGVKLSWLIRTILTDYAGTPEALRNYRAKFVRAPSKK
jgi:antitoxin component of RelBE/YafQ-DinJ toxin-antitoxin module